MMNRNYDKELRQLLIRPENKGRHLLLHSCCAPCSSYVLELLRPFLKISVYYYNPNISITEEYRRRVEEQQRLIRELNKTAAADGGYEISFVEGKYEPERFFEAVRGLEECAEGGARCLKCYELRLTEAVKKAKELNADYITTSLTISPLKAAKILNETGEKAAAEGGVLYLPSDFKKQNGYRRSVELSKEYGLYRQDYCGCVYSMEK